MSTQLSFSYLASQRQTAVAPRRRLCDLPTEERPLYRLRRHGSNALSTAELLALLLGTADAPGLSQELLQEFGSLHGLARASKEQLMRLRGIGEAQAARLIAIMELSRRLQAPPAEEKPRVSSPADGANLLLPRLSHLEQEELHVLLLDTRNRVMGIRAIYKGSLNSSMVRIGEIFRPAIEAPAAAVIVAHNHPSGQPDPSPEDITVTRKIVAAGKLLDIAVLDHLVIGQGVYVSLKERNLGFD
ncbi:MAG TPA: JAB domain-containing protein [Anaerolineae bacterium]|nr:JAB domain-containing protein [Anaerolineae bacterium]